MPRESRDSRDLSRAEMCVLALVAEKPAHGWAISRELEPGGDIGRIWSGDRQRVYRALRILETRKLVEPAGVEPGDGAHRTIYRVTPQGTKELEPWLLAPAERAREVQSTFLLKLALARRQGIDPAPLVSAQRAVLAKTVDDLTTRYERRTDTEERLHLGLRLETSRVFLRFLDELNSLYGSPVAGGAQSEEPRVHRTDASDFTATPIPRAEERATIILRHGDDRRPIVVATAHVDDPIVEEIHRAGRPADQAG